MTCPVQPVPKADLRVRAEYSQVKPIPGQVATGTSHAGAAKVTPPQGLQAAGEERPMGQTHKTLRLMDKDREQWTLSGPRDLRRQQRALK